MNWAWHFWDNDLEELKRTWRCSPAYVFYAKIGQVETNHFDMADVAK